jgi:hypothetical protein
MKKIFKIIGIVVILLLGAIITIPFLFKDKIIARAKEEANKNLNAKIDFGAFDITLLSTFPKLGIQVDKLSIIGINEFAGDTLIALGSLEVNLDLMSVINGERYDIHSILLDHPRIHAIVLADGKANWDITKPSTDTSTTASEPTKFKLQLNKFEIIEGSIFYDDQQGKMYASLDHLNHELSGDFTQDLFTMDTKTSMENLTYKDAGMAYLKKAKLAIDAEIDMDMLKSKYTFKDNEFKINALVFGLDGFIAMPKEDIDMDLKFLAKQASFKEFLSLVPGVYTADFADVKTSGQLSFNGYAKGILSEKTIPAFGLTLDVKNGKFQYPSLPKSVDNINIDLKIACPDGMPNNMVTDIKKFHMEIAANPIDMKMLILTAETDPNLDGWIKANLNLASIREAIPLEKDEVLTGIIGADVVLKGKMSSIDKGEYENFDAKGWIEITNMDYNSKSVGYPVKVAAARLDFSPQQLDLKKLNALVGESDFDLSGTISNYLGWFLRDDALSGRMNLSSKVINLNQFMSSEEETTAKVDTASTGVVEVPSNLDLSLTASIEKLLYENLNIANVKGKIDVKNSVASMDNLMMNLLGGSVNMSGKYATTNPKQPDVVFALVITELDIPATYAAFNTVKKMAPVAKYAKGTFSSTLTFAAKMDDKMDPVMNTLQGAGNLKTKTVTISGLPAMVKLADAIKMDQYKKMDLKDVNISFKFKDGRVNVEPFDIKQGNNKMTIAGSSGFDQSINYDLKLDLTRADLGGAANNAMNSLVSQANSKGAKFTLGDRIPLNAKLTGTVTNPKIETSLKESGNKLVDDLKDKAKEEFNKKKEELENKARAEADKAKAEAEAKLRAEGDKLKAEADKKKKEAEDKAKAEADKLKAEAEKKKKEAEEKAKNEAKKKLKGILGK